MVGRICLLALLVFSQSGLAFGEEKSTSSRSAMSKEYRDILRSPAIRSSGKDNRAWTRDGTNLAKIFAKGGHGLHSVTPLLSTSTPGYRGGEEFHDQNRTFAEVRKTYYILSNYQRIIMRIMIPARPSIETVQYGLVKEFQELEPPKLAAELESTHTINGIEGKLYRPKIGRNCSLLFRIAGETRVQLIAPRCADNDFMLDLAEKLNIQQLDDYLRG